MKRIKVEREIVMFKRKQHDLMNVETKLLRISQRREVEIRQVAKNSGVNGHS